MKLFESYDLKGQKLKNRMVMAPMTRSRAIGNIPNELMAVYYGQRAEAGLIITEGTSPSPNGLGYCRIPGIFNREQVAAWKKVTNAVHDKAGKIFVQLMHTGRVSHPLNLPEGAEVLAPSAVQISGQMYTDQQGMQDYPLAKAMSTAEVKMAISEYVQAANYAMEAGFDGIELHGANGYLIEQFLNPNTNKREDEYGGSIENRCRFALEIAKQSSEAIGAEHVAIRVSPYGVASDMQPYDKVDETYTYLATELGKLGLAYIHIVDHSGLGAPEVPAKIKQDITRAFGGTIIASGNLDKESGNRALEKGTGHLAAFGRPFLANPDLVNRYKNDLELNILDMKTFYTPGEKGYTDYPVAEFSDEAVKS